MNRNGAIIIIINEIVTHNQSERPGYLIAQKCRNSGAQVVFDFALIGGAKKRQQSADRISWHQFEISGNCVLKIRPYLANRKFIKS